jgi:hypothetical protein
MMQNIVRILIQYRTSTISREAAILTLVLAALALTIAMWTQLKFAALPNMMPLTVGVLVLDILSQFAPQTPTVRAVQSMLFGVLYLAITCFCGVLAAYATQRFSLPLQDQFFERTDLALGVNWFDAVHWVDDRPVIHEILKLAYGTMSAQIALPVVVLAFLESVRRLQAGLQSFLSMRRIEARRKNASAFRLRFSQSLASLRQRLSHAMVRSTIQRLGKTTNPLT